MADKDPVKAAPAKAPAAPPAEPVSSGGGMSETERDLRNTNVALSEENKRLRGELERAGREVPEAREPSFAMSQGVRSDLINAAAAVEHGDVRAEDVAVVDPASGKVFSLADAPEPDEHGM